MPLKLKLKVRPGSSSGGPESTAPEQKPLPRLKLKTSSANRDDFGGVTKPKQPKEKLKKLKISLGKPSSSHLSHGISLGLSHREPSAPVQPIPRKVPKVRIKPTRVPGEGYDSEAPDVEDDPLIEQAVLVRFANDANLDFLHSAADTSDFSNVNIKWITRDKAVVNVNLTLYSARLIDLPTLTELYKTVDKKNIMKTVDVCQILLVLRTINPKNLNMEADFEVPPEYTYTHPLYKLLVHKEIRPTKTVYRNGLSHPFEDAYRRFRPRKVNHRLMTDVELRVDEIVRRDNEAQESHYEYVNPKLQPQRSEGPQPTQDATQKVSAAHDFNGHSENISMVGTDMENEDDQMALDLEADLDIALEQELADALDLTSKNTAANVLMKSEYDNDDMDEGAVTGANDDEDEDDDEDDDDEDEDEEDDDVKRDKSRAKKLEEEIADLQTAADKQKVLLATASYKMMRMKFQSAYNGLKLQLDSKKRELSKLREQQNKQIQEAPGGLRRHEEEDEEDDDEEDDDVEEEIQDQEENDPSANAVLDSLGGQGQPDNGEEDAGGLDEDNYDDFQGLF